MSETPDARLPPGYDTEAIPAMAEDPQADRGRQLVWLILGQAIAGLSLVLWLVIAIVTTIAVSAEGGAGAWIFGAIVWAYPVWPIGFSIAAWLHWRRGRASWAALLIGLACLPGVILLALVVVSAL